MTATTSEGSQTHHRTALTPAALACMGVVFGDIGTSPLYTLQIATKAASPSGAISPEAVLGIVSLIFWSLIIVISIKYAILIMRAEQPRRGRYPGASRLGESASRQDNRRRAAMVIVGLIGATLLYGDGTITPAISVLSAIEGIKLYAPQTERFVVPLTLVILVVLFVIQRKGTSWVGGIFGPVMLVWFVLIGILGIVGIAKAPAILAALSPLPAITYLSHAGPLALAVIGGAFLAVTGGEAFYADMGHFGPLPDSRRLVRCGAAGLDAQLFRPRGTPADRARGGGELLLSARPGMVALRLWSHWRRSRPSSPPNRSSPAPIR